MEIVLGRNLLEKYCECMIRFSINTGLKYMCMVMFCVIFLPKYLDFREHLFLEKCIMLLSGCHYLINHRISKNYSFTKLIHYCA